MYREANNDSAKQSMKKQNIKTLSIIKGEKSNEKNYYYYNFSISNR